MQIPGQTEPIVDILGSSPVKALNNANQQLSHSALYKSADLGKDSPEWDQHWIIEEKPSFYRKGRTSFSESFREHAPIYSLIIVLAVIVLVLFILVIILYSRLTNLRVRNLLVTNHTYMGISSLLELPNLNFACPPASNSPGAIAYCQQIPQGINLSMYAPSVRTGTINSRRYRISDLYYSNVSLQKLESPSSLEVTNLTAEDIMANNVQYNTELIQIASANFKEGTISTTDFSNSNFTGAVPGFNLVELRAMNLRFASTPPTQEVIIKANELNLTNTASSPNLPSVNANISLRILEGALATGQTVPLAWTFENVMSQQEGTTGMPEASTTSIMCQGSSCMLNATITKELQTQTIDFTAMGNRNAEIDIIFNVNKATVDSCTIDNLVIPMDNNAGTGLLIKSFARDKDLSISHLIVGNLRFDRDGICNARENPNLATRLCVLSAAGSSTIDQINATSIRSNGELTSRFCQCKQ